MEVFVVLQFSDDVRDVCAKKQPTKSQQKEVVNNFCSGRQYDQLKREDGWIFSITKMNLGKPTEGGGARGRTQNSPKSACRCLHFRPRNRGKGEEVVKVGFVLTLLLSLETI